MHSTSCSTFSKLLSQSPRADPRKVREEAVLNGRRRFIASHSLSFPLSLGTRCCRIALIHCCLLFIGQWQHDIWPPPCVTFARHRCQCSHCVPDLFTVFHTVPILFIFPLIYIFIAFSLLYGTLLQPKFLSALTGADVTRPGKWKCSSESMLKLHSSFTPGRCSSWFHCK